MSNVAIRVEGLGKQYRIGAKQEKYRTLRQTITDTATAPVRRASSLLRGQAYGAAELTHEIWALKDLNFEVKHGEVLGIIGHNGAGKSTLLKILSRITEPSEGYADIYGRVGSLLEVGTGFHDELTGRENVYLNGAILGMSREEINRKFDEIVAFAGVETFIDTPVKHYSSGMRLRLGFSVAAHLEPEILVVDEVLAVGDAEFQKKCLGKMSDVAGEGRTVLFVSHNMSAIMRLCQKTMWLDHGHVSMIGETSEVISNYLDNAHTTDRIDLSDHPNRRRGKTPLLKEARLFADDEPSSIFTTGGRFRLDVRVIAPPKDLPHIAPEFKIKDGIGGAVFSANLKQTQATVENISGDYTFSVTMDPFNLNPGRYSISLRMSDGTVDHDVIDSALHFDVVWDNALGFPPKAAWGPHYAPVEWAYHPNTERAAEPVRSG